MEIVKKTNHFVVKIGGSVLIDSSAYERQAKMLIDFSQEVDRVYAVLSASKGRTDELIEGICRSKAERESIDRLIKHGDYSRQSDVEQFDTHWVASHLLAGEIESTKRFERALRKFGVYPETLIQGVNFPIIANGRYLNAHLDLDASQKTDVISSLESKIVLVAGFGAQNHHSEKVLLGRNASDYVAALIGHLDPHVSEVIYLKDVDGVYANFGTKGQRLIERISASELSTIGCGKVLDERCLQHTGRYRIRVQHCYSQIGKTGTIIN
jgi:aspartate kinase